MDTDDLTEMAWDVIVRAACVSDTLKAELGAMARRFQSEDEWLRGVRAHLEKITENPAEYADAWDLENEEGITATMIGSCAAELFLRVNEILAIPLSRRGARAW
ncbi:MAG: hypothetical protein LUO80_07790 [Methylococcaceae bacterium]|jgi:hypothetical protein|nr:hypothetical protein [Methylococcaceae bacterium]